MKEVEEQFCQLYVELKDEIKAVQQAFGKMSLQEAKDHAFYLLNRADIKARIQDGVMSVVGAASSSTDIEDALGKVAREALFRGDLANANRALENLAKVKGMFVDRKEIKTTQIKDEEDLDEAISRLSNVVQLRSKA